MASIENRSRTLISVSKRTELTKYFSFDQKDEATQYLGGLVNTIPDQQAGTRERCCKHSDEFKANAVASCMQPGMSMAAVPTQLNSKLEELLTHRWQLHDGERAASHE